MSELNDLLLSEEAGVANKDIHEVVESMCCQVGTSTKKGTPKSSKMKEQAADD